MRCCKIDDNQKEIVKALRAIGASVQSIATVGKGCPDILVGFRGINYIMEIKDGSKAPSQQKLTDDEDNWHNSWNGNVVIVNNIDSALDVIM